MPVENEVDRMLKLLREKIRDKGYTQLKVQEALGWGRTYISQLFRKQKSLRFDQILHILNIIGVDPGLFFAEYYDLEHPGIEEDAHIIRRRLRRYGVPEVPGAADEVRALVTSLTELLVKKKVLTPEEAAEATGS